MTQRRVYLAGPTVFFPDALSCGAALKNLCQKYGLFGVFPLDELELTGPLSAKFIFDQNIARLRSCDVVVADISPFRGPHADDGTAFEIGFAYALRLPIFGYSNELRSLSLRIPAGNSRDSKLRDEVGLEIENFGLAQNLMLACAIVGLHADPEAAIAAAAKYLSMSNI